MKSSDSRLSLLAISLCVLALSCSERRPREGAAQQSFQATHLRTELYFGLSKPGGERVTETEWNNFLETCVTPLLPDGLSVFECKGQYRDAAGKVQKEGTKVLLVIHPDEPRFSAAFRKIIETYEREFQQTSVLQTKQPIQAKF